jgi:hypothetical protein
MILTSILILGGVGLTFAVLIALANKRLKVWEDPRIDVVASMLQCQLRRLWPPGCRAFAEQAVAGGIAPPCTVSSEAASSPSPATRGRQGRGRQARARLRCAGGSDVAVQRAEYRGLNRALRRPRWRQGVHVGMPGPRRLRGLVRLRCHSHECDRHSGGGSRQVHGVWRLCGGVPEGPLRAHARLATPAGAVPNLLSGDEVLEQCKVFARRAGDVWTRRRAHQCGLGRRRDHP